MKNRDEEETELSSKELPVDCMTSNLLSDEKQHPELNLRKTAVLVTILGQAQFFIFLSSNCQSSFYPIVASQRGLTGVQTGWILGILSLISIFMDYAELKLMKCISMKKQSVFGLVSSGLLCIAFGYLNLIEDNSTFIIWQLIIRFFHGICMSATDNSNFVLVNIRTPIKYLATSMGILDACLSLALLVSAPFGAYLYQIGNYQTPYLVAGGLSIASSLVVAVFVEEIDYKDETTVMVAIEKTLTKDMIYYLYVFVTYGALLGLFSSMMEPKLREYNLNLEQVGWVIMIPNAVQTLALPIWGQICDRTKRYLFVNILSCITLIIGMIMFGPFPGTQLLRLNLPILMSSLVICGVGMSGLSVSGFLQCKIHLMTTCSDTLAGTLVSITYIGFSSVGVSIGDVLGGLFIDYIGYSWGSVLLTVFLLISIILLFVSTKREINIDEKSPLNIKDKL